MVEYLLNRFLRSRLQDTRYCWKQTSTGFKKDLWKLRSFKFLSLNKIRTPMIPGYLFWYSTLLQREGLHNRFALKLKDQPVCYYQTFTQIQHSWRQTEALKNSKQWYLWNWWQPIFWCILIYIITKPKWNKIHSWTYHKSYLPISSDIIWSRIFHFKQKQKKPKRVIDIEKIISTSENSAISILSICNL